MQSYNNNMQSKLVYKSYKSDRTNKWQYKLIFYNKLRSYLNIQKQIFLPKFMFIYCKHVPFIGHTKY